MLATGEAVQDLVEFADKKVSDGTMSKNRLLLPSPRRLQKWLTSIFQDEDSTAEESPDLLERGVSIVYLGDGYNQKKDPEHLPATNAWQRLGNGLRTVSKLLGSEESMFGLRVACATMTVGIVCFLEATQVFFQEQRLVWAMIIIALGMTQSKLNPVSREIYRLTKCPSRWPVHIWLLLQDSRQLPGHGLLVHYLVHR